MIRWKFNIRVFNMLWFFENLNAIWEIQMQSQFKQIFYTFSIPTKITAQENAEILL